MQLQSLCRVFTVHIQDYFQTTQLSLAGWLILILRIWTKDAFSHSIYKHTYNIYMTYKHLISCIIKKKKKKKEMGEKKKEKLHQTLFWKSTDALWQVKPAELNGLTYSKISVTQLWMTYWPWWLIWSGFQVPRIFLTAQENKYLGIF